MISFGDTSLAFKKILLSAHTVHLCVFCGSQNKLRLFCSTTLIGRFIQGESLARGPKLLSVYTVEQRGFLLRKYWQTGHLKHARRHRSVASRNWLKS